MGSLAEQGFQPRASAVYYNCKDMTHGYMDTTTNTCKAVTTVCKDTVYGGARLLRQVSSPRTGVALAAGIATAYVVHTQVNSPLLELIQRDLDHYQEDYNTGRHADQHSVNIDLLAVTYSNYYCLRLLAYTLMGVSGTLAAAATGIAYGGVKCCVHGMSQCAKALGRRATSMLYHPNAGPKPMRVQV